MSPSTTADTELTSTRDFGVYATAMDAGMQKKIADLQPTLTHLQPDDTLADLGCGTGLMLQHLADLVPDGRAYGIDLSTTLLQHATNNLRQPDGHSNVQLVEANLTRLPLPDNHVDTAVLSSVLHEVYSYNNYSRQAVRKALTETHRVLKPGGRLAIRDGVAPANGTQPVHLTCHTPQTIKWLHRFAAEFRRGHSTQGIQMQPVAGRPDTFRMSLHDANEFLSKKDYHTNWDSEVLEEFGVFTPTQWKQELAAAGFIVHDSWTYVHPWVRTNRYEGTVTLATPAGHRLGWPPTTVVLHTTTGR